MSLSGSVCSLSGILGSGSMTTFSPSVQSLMRIRNPGTRKSFFFHFSRRLRCISWQDWIMGDIIGRQKFQYGSGFLDDSLRHLGNSSFSSRRSRIVFSPVRFASSLIADMRYVIRDSIVSCDIQHTWALSFSCLVFRSCSVHSGV